MERCDFSSVITIIRRFISDDHNLNQIDLLYEMFASFISDKDSRNFDFDNGLVCRWMNGLAKISPRISGFYMDKEHREQLAADIQMHILPLMYDSAMAVQEVYGTFIQDSSISDKVKKEISRNYPCQTEQQEAEFLTAVLCFGMEREFVKRDARSKNLLASGNLSPVVSDFVMDSGVPKPCRYFCGRNQELTDIHNMLLEHGKVFLHGIAGIGKSELAKAYAKRHSKEYTNILYFTYTGDLAQDIADMDFADDLPDDSEQERFHKHNRFLRTLKEDTLLIVDNFNTTASQDSTLSVVMKYRCVCCSPHAAALITILLWDWRKSLTSRHCCSLPVVSTPTQTNTGRFWSKSSIRFTATLWLWSWRHVCLKLAFWNHCPC